MVIKIAKNYDLDQMLYESDRKAYWDDGPLAKTFRTD